MLVKACAPSIDESLGIDLPLIVVNCIILGRAEMYASKNSVLPSILAGLGTVSYTHLAIFIDQDKRVFITEGLRSRVSITAEGYMLLGSRS